MRRAPRGVRPDESGPRCRIKDILACRSTYATPTAPARWYNPQMSHYRALRRGLAKLLSGQGIVHLQGGKLVSRNSDVEYAFRQNSDFLYVTGVEEPGCHLV